MRNIKIRKENGAKYYKGLVKGINKTKLGHLYLNLEDTKIVKNFDGALVYIKSNYPESGFVIPKRRERIFEWSKENIEEGQEVLIKVEKENRSDGVSISEVQIISRGI